MSSTHQVPLRQVSYYPHFIYDENILSYTMWCDKYCHQEFSRGSPSFILCLFTMPCISERELGRTFPSWRLSVVSLALNCWLPKANSGGSVNSFVLNGAAGTNFFFLLPVILTFLSSVHHRAATDCRSECICLDSAHRKSGLNRQVFLIVSIRWQCNLTLLFALQAGSCPATDNAASREPLVSSSRSSI